MTPDPPHSAYFGGDGKQNRTGPVTFLPGRELLPREDRLGSTFTQTPGDLTVTDQLLSATRTAIFTLLLILGVARPSQAASVIMPNIPDFYQHQLWKPDGSSSWESDGGWCQFTAIVDALYPWTVQANYAGLLDPNITKAGTWLGAANTTIAGVHGTFDTSGLGAINNHLKMRGFGVSAAIAGNPSLLSMWYSVDPTTGNVSVHLAGNRVEVVQKGGANYSGFDFYKDQLDQGRSTIVTFRPTVAGQNGLWWAGGLGGGNFHSVAGAGYDAATRSILFADPDSNKGNLRANAGWFPTRPGDPPTATVVNTNKYTPADGANGPPLPSKLKGDGTPYTTSDLYGTAKLNANGYTVASSNAGPGEMPATGRYTGVRISDIETISPTLAALKGLIQLGANKFQATFRILGDLFSSVDRVEIFPTVKLADQSFSFSRTGWSESSVNTDPFGYTRTLGGELLTANSGTYLISGDMGLATLDTTKSFSTFDVYVHDSKTDEWLVQSVGAPGNPNTLQTVPEPASGILLAAGMVLVILWALGRRRVNPSAASAAGASGPGAIRYPQPAHHRS
jgi:hypothetical protein